MGVLQKWDQHNQRIADWQLNREKVVRDEGRRVPWYGIGGVALAILFLPTVLRRFLGIDWHIGLLSTAAQAALFVGFILRDRRRRLRWEASRSAGPKGPPAKPRSG